MCSADIAEIAGGNAHVHSRVFTKAFTQAQPRRDVVDNLCQQARPVDGVDGTDMPLLLELRVDIDGFDQVLTVIENAVNSHVHDVLVEEREHLCALERRHTTCGRQHDNAQALAPTEGVLGGASRITRGGTDDGEPISAALKFILEKLAEQLHGHVLECGCGAVGQVCEPEVFFLAQASHGDNLRVGKDRGAVGASTDGFNIWTGNIVDKQLKNSRCKGRITAFLKYARPFTQLIVAERGVAFGQVQATIRRKSCEQNVAEGRGSGLGVSGRNVTHGLTLP